MINKDLKQMKRLEDIGRILSGIKGELEEKCEVKEIGIFGAYVRHEQRESSVWVCKVER